MMQFLPVAPLEYLGGALRGGTHISVEKGWFITLNIFSGENLSQSINIAFCLVHGQTFSFCPSLEMEFFSSYWHYHFTATSGPHFVSLISRVCLCFCLLRWLICLEYCTGLIFLSFPSVGASDSCQGPARLSDWLMLFLLEPGMPALLKSLLGFLEC